jgi:hypothetical protein
MEPGQRVRIRQSSSVARNWRIPWGAEGTVLCRYRLLKAAQTAPGRIDVRFSPQLIVWGAPEVEFEAIGELGP